MEKSGVTPARAKEITRVISEAARASRNEAEFRTKFSRVIEDFAKELDIPILVREEYTLATGRADAAYNRLILEYEPPGSLRDTLKHGHTAHAVQQVKDYIEGVAEKERQRISRLVGVALDGHYYVFVRHVDGHFLVEDPVAVNEHTTGRFLRLLVSLTSGKALLPDNLIADFGSHTLTAERAAKGFYDALRATLKREPEGLVAKLFEQWQTFYGEVTGYGVGSTQIKHKRELVHFAAGMGVAAKELDPPLLFFTVHTYFSLLVKLIAYLALSRFVSGFGTRFGSLYSLDDEALAKEIEELERGGLFRRLGIRNFLEGDFFRWYLKTWNKDVADSVRLLVDRLKDYDPGTLEVSPEAARDLLKKLYHYLMPRELRHDLGEYYTPDWLAERLLNQLGYQGDPMKRLLDPACGSGTFLILAIARLKDRCLRKEGMNEQQTLKTILRNIVGIDLNPLAVIAARTNFVLAIRELLEHRTEEIDIPVYLADSIVSPEVGKTLFSKDRYEIKTTVGPLDIPSALKSRKQIDDLANLIGECVETDVKPEEFIARAEKMLGIAAERWKGTDGQGEAARDILAGLYTKLTKLHEKGLDGIWAAIVKNYFMPLFVGQFDLVAGNPPWVNWDNLPEDYRDNTKPIWTRHGLFPHGGMDTILGKGKKDISMLMAYEVCDALLKNSGRLGFVITQSVLKTGSGQGFRKFKLVGGASLAVGHVDDMVDLQPFEAATNRTSVVILEKGRPNSYPVAYTIWQKTVRGKRVGYDLTLPEAWEITRRLNYVAEPVDGRDETSAWLTARRKAVRALRKMSGQSDYEAHEGVNTGGANGIYWLTIIQERKDETVLVQNLTDGAKRKVEQITAALEEDFVFPLVRGRDIQRWHAHPSAHILMVQDVNARRGIEEATLQASYPKTWAYLKHFERDLRNRAAFKRFFTRKQKGQVIETGPFYSMFDVGEYTLAPWKVVWKYIAAEFTCSVLAPPHGSDGKICIPDHRLIAVECQGPGEAFYVAGVLNSVSCRLFTRAYMIETQLSTHVLENIKVPRFSASDKAHKRISELSLNAHKKREKNEPVENLEEEINKLAAGLWSISEDELDDIEYCYRELTKADLSLKEDEAEEDGGGEGDEDEG
jgi:methylase of polypeptide subunit release factors